MVSFLRMFQYLLVVLYFILLDDVTANQKTVYQIKDGLGNPVYIQLEPVGCFRDKQRPRALRVFYLNFRSSINWRVYPDTSYIIKECAEKAYRQHFYGMFAVQYYGECWSDGSAEDRYNIHGVSSNCEHGVGKNWANMVYRYKVVPKPTCHMNGRAYNEGEEMLIYKNTTTAGTHYSRCISCTCIGGEPTECKLGFVCESDPQTLCLNHKYLPGQCCPVCVAKTTPAPTSEIIPTQTERPPPMFPPRSFD